MGIQIDEFRRMIALNKSKNQAVIFDLSENQVEKFRKEIFKESPYLHLDYHRIGDNLHLVFNEDPKKPSLVLGEINKDPNVCDLYHLKMDKIIPNLSYETPNFFDGTKNMISRIEEIAKNL